ncbi:MAG TPA: Asp-tRNA(Asn)/Glu-tRNA(Gln) amidotransferase subunit GatA, partial [Mucilaginibacter sp.]|nr:Asp-tRNA(Asn)/Glu-tRNA(Gln) amidotransferase subunit GatA [Mucilaginibacter sp.]
MTKFYSSLDEIKEELKRGKVTVEGLVKHYLERIKTYAHLNAFNEVFEHEALSRAKEIDSRIR